MEHFFYDDIFCRDLEDLINKLQIDDVSELDDDWSTKIEHSTLEPIFEIDADKLCDLLSDHHEERFSEDGEEKEDVLKAIKRSVDFAVLSELLPQLYYPNGQFSTITKADLIEYQCN